ncbi:hypothetical protein UFOVP24_32 [uncultured Caudovirales phage]|uniref:Uncharacterized protein n=1 Tax=uncultured Caudovirales phage TaxID=2100421 RepID=A0A6J5TA07_9CAUD|nr:hypothetical protein UFOVP24_32 [uncultured Caudovirales phage]
MNLPQLPQDKANHLAYGALTFSIVLLIAHFLFPNDQIGFACLITVLSAIGKEASDAWINWKATGDPMKGPHGVELLDAVATISGGALAGLPLLILQIPIIQG